VIYIAELPTVRIKLKIRAVLQCLVMDLSEFIFVQTESLLLVKYFASVTWSRCCSTK